MAQSLHSMPGIGPMARTRTSEIFDPATGKPMPEGVAYRGPSQYRALCCRSKHAAISGRYRRKSQAGLTFSIDSRATDVAELSPRMAPIPAVATMDAVFPHKPPLCPCNQTHGQPGSSLNHPVVARVTHLVFTQLSFCRAFHERSLLDGSVGLSVGGTSCFIPH